MILTPHNRRVLLAGVLLVACVPVASCSRLSPARTPLVVQVSVDASSTGAPLNEGLIGVNGPGPTGAAPLLKKIGVNWIRIGIGLAGSYDCATGKWNPTSLDTQVAAAFADGGTPEIDVGGTPTCMVTDPPTGQSVNNDPPDIGTANQTAWDNLVYQMGYHEMTTEGVRIFEVENEPDWVSWNGTMQQYFQVYSDTATSLEKAARAAGVTIEVGGPVLANIADTMDMAWLQPFLAYVSANGLPLNFLSWHNYPNDPFAGPGPAKGEGPYCWGQPPGPNGNPCYYSRNLNVTTFANEARQAEQALATFPTLHPLLVIDEWNLDGEYDIRQNGPFDAAFAAAALTEAQMAGVDRMCIWYTADKPGTLGNWGLLFSDLKPKPIYETFLFWHESAGDLVATSFDPPTQLGDYRGTVGGVSSLSSDGTLSVLLYNFQPYDFSGKYGTVDPNPSDHQVVLDVTGLKSSTTYAWTRYSIDATHLGTQVASGERYGHQRGHAKIMFDLPGDSVSLVTFTP